VLGATVALADRQVVLERSVRLLQRIPELVTLEDVLAGLHKLPVPEMGVDDTADCPDCAGLPLDPDHDRLLATCVVDSVEHPLREPAAVGGDLHDFDYTIVPVATRFGNLFRNPFSFLFTRSSAEEQVVAYLTREHRRGRNVAEILQDRYVQNRLTPQQQARLLDRPEVVRTLGEQDVDAARESLGSR
jgi:hypothetical protein